MAAGRETGKNNGDESGERKGPSRRGQGEGSIWQRPDGRWQARVDLGWVDGKRKRKDLYADTQKAAIALLAKARSDRDRGLPLAPERQTVEQFLERWLKDSVHHTVRQSTFDSYSQLVRLHIVPHIGKRPLAKLSPQDVSGLYNTLLGQGRKDMGKGTDAQGLSARTVQYVGVVLSRALKQAMRWDLVPRNVCDLVDKPRLQRKEMQALDLPTLLRFLDIASGERLYAIFLLAIVSGLREGELLGLMWTDIDWQGERLTVRRQLVRDSTGIHFQEVKTAKGRRSISLPAKCMATLKVHRAHQNEERLALGPAWKDQDLVFPTELGTPFERQNFIRQAFKPLLPVAGLPSTFRFHDLRHSHATLLLAMETHPKVVQSRLGHSTITTTMDTYSHMVQSLDQDVAAKLDKILPAQKL